MAVKPFDAFWQCAAQILSRHSQTRARPTRIVKRSLNRRIAWINTESERYRMVNRLSYRCETLVLRYRVERDVRTASGNFGKLAAGVNRSIGMCQRMHLVNSQTCLRKRAGSGAETIFANNRENLPQGKSLERHNDFHAGPFFNRMNKGQVTAETGLVDHIAWRRKRFVVNKHFRSLKI